MAGRRNVISGFVRDARGQPVADARVYFRSGPEPLPDIAALTNDAGEFSLSVPAAGTYVLEVSADGFAPETTTAAVEGRKSEAMIIRLRDEGRRT